MTGFARSDGAEGVWAWHWEARSVNSRGLDVRVRLAPGFDTLEQSVREEIAKRFLRGSIQVNLSIERAGASTEIRVNEAALKQVAAAAQRLVELTGAAPPRADGLLALRGVLETVEASETEEQAAALRSALTRSLIEMLDRLSSARASEGQRLQGVVSAQIDEIARLTALVEASPTRTVEAIRARLAQTVAKLTDAAPSLDPVRLHQEAVLAATRADVEEELKRLHAHVAAARELLADPKGAGRKLDFLAQEFNREANTLTSKANDHDVASNGLALKAVIDQMREQVQNIE